MLLSCLEELSQVLRDVLRWLAVLLMDVAVDVVALEHRVASHVVYTGEEVSDEVGDDADELGKSSVRAGARTAS